MKKEYVKPELAVEVLPHEFCMLSGSSQGTEEGEGEAGTNERRGWGNLWD